MRLETRKQTVFPVSRTVERPVLRWRRLLLPLLAEGEEARTGGGERGGSEQGESRLSMKLRGESGLWLFMRISTSYKRDIVLNGRSRNLVTFILLFNVVDPNPHC